MLSIFCTHTADDLNCKLQKHLNIIEEQVRSPGNMITHIFNLICSCCRQRDLDAALSIESIDEALNLVQQGANPNLASKNLHIRLLHLMSAVGNRDIINMLLKHNANPQLCDSRGHNAYHYARLIDNSDKQHIINLLNTSPAAPVTIAKKLK